MRVVNEGNAKGNQRNNDGNSMSRSVHHEEPCTSLGAMLPFCLFCIMYNSTEQ